MIAAISARVLIVTLLIVTLGRLALATSASECAWVFSY
jgi:hypothetical protein